MKLLIFIVLFIILIFKKCDSAPLDQGFGESFPKTFYRINEKTEKTSNKIIVNEYKKNEVKSRYSIQPIKYKSLLNFFFN